MATVGSSQGETLQRGAGQNSLPDVELDSLVGSLRERYERTGERVILGIAGPPGTGKSTLAEYVATRFGDNESIIVPMDGFHLAQNVIEGSELADRRGAIDTFDADGYIALLRRLRARTDPVVYAPAYRRGLEDPIAASIAVPADVPVVITEGNYLLAELEPWPSVRQYLTECWFVDTPPAVRIERLIARHVQFGKELKAATAWALGPDEANARFIESTRVRADRIIAWS